MSAKRIPLAKPVAVSSELYADVGRYAGSIVLTVFEQIGGIGRMAEWADENPEAFFTKSFSKIITAPKQVEHTGTVRIEDAIRALDAEEGRDYSYLPLSDYDPITPTLTNDLSEIDIEQF
jgi:hypothetical protein